MKKTLEEKVAKNSLSSIDKIAVCSFFMLLYDGCHLFTHEYWQLPFQEPDLEKFSQSVKNVLTKLNIVIDAPVDKKEAVVNSCLQLKKSLLEMADTLHAYQIKLDLFESLADRQLIYLEYAELKSSGGTFNFDKFRKNCAQYLDGQTPAENATKQAKLLGVLPLVMDDSEITGYFERALKGQLKGCLRSDVLALCHAVYHWIAPEETKDYGRIISEIPPKIDALLKIDPSAMDETALEQLIAQDAELFDQINTIYDFILTLYSDVNFLCILMSCMLTYDDIAGNQPVYHDLYLKAVEMLENNFKEKDLYLDSFLQTVDTHIEENVALLTQLAERQQLIYNNIDFEQLSVNTQTILSMEYYLNTVFYANLSDDQQTLAFTNEDNIPADETFIQEQVAQLAVKITEALSALNQTQRADYKEALVQQVFPLVDCPWSQDEMNAYIEKGIQSADSFEKAATMIEKAADLFEENTTL